MHKTADQRNQVAIPPPLNEHVLVASMLFVTALVYAATVRFQFVYDDDGQIVQNALIRSWKFVPQYFRGQVWEYLFPDAPANYYRPLNVLWFRINHAVFGLHPSGWHLAAVLLHLLATFLAYRVARRLTGRPLVAVLAALVFGVHPMRHEVVAWVSGTTESLWSVLFFCAFLAYLRSRENHRIVWMGISCLCYTAALLSKETAMVLPVVVFAHAWIYADAHGRSSPEGSPEADEPRSVWQLRLQAALLALAYVPFAAMYVLIRVRVLHGFSHPMVQINARTWALTLPSIIFFYVRQWFLPVHVSEFYDLPLAASVDKVHVLLPALAILALGVGLWFIRRTLGRREVEFAAIWTLLTLLPAFDFGVFPPGQLVHDRYFYLPGFGAALIVALAMGKLAHGPVVFRLPRVWLLASLTLLVPLCYGSAYAAKFWTSDYVLFEHAYRIAPANTTVRNNYAIALAHRGDYEHALPILKQLLIDHPDSWLANYNSGRLFYELGMFAQSKMYFEQAEILRPAMADIYVQLAMIDLRTGHADQAEAKLRHALDLQPINAAFRFALGVVLASKSDCVAARAQFSQALLLQPGFTRAREQIAKCGSAASEAAPVMQTPAIHSAPPGDRAGASALAATRHPAVSPTAANLSLASPDPASGAAAGSTAAASTPARSRSAHSTPARSTPADPSAAHPTARAGSY